MKVKTTVSKPLPRGIVTEMRQSWRLALEEQLELKCISPPTPKSIFQDDLKLSDLTNFLACPSGEWAQGRVQHKNIHSL